MSNTAGKFIGTIPEWTTEQVRVKHPEFNWDEGCNRVLLQFLFSKMLQDKPEIMLEFGEFMKKQKAQNEQTK
jgi:hypothetical protein